MCMPGPAFLAIFSALICFFFVIFGPLQLWTSHISTPTNAQAELHGQSGSGGQRFVAARAEQDCAERAGADRDAGEGPHQGRVEDLDARTLVSSIPSVLIASF